VGQDTKRLLEKDVGNARASLLPRMVTLAGVPHGNPTQRACRQHHERGEPLGSSLQAAAKEGRAAHHRLHDLRHTCATILLMAGKHPRYVQELPGRVNISITLNTYSHVTEGMDGRLADAMDEAV
jgi:integrase